MSSSESNAMARTILGDQPRAEEGDEVVDVRLEARAPDPEVFVAQGRGMFEQLRASGVILGTRGR